LKKVKQLYINPKTISRRKIAPVHSFSIRVCLKIFNQGPIENKKSGFDEKISIKV